MYAKPNIKKWFIPDEGMQIWEVDLKQADAQVVAWDANDEALMALFTDLSRLPAGEDEKHGPACPCLHCRNCVDIYGKWTPLGRHLAKRGVHAANYGVGEYTLAKSLGITRKEAAEFISRWLGNHPAIVEWNKRIKASLKDPKTRGVRNAFGYRRVWSGRTDDHALKEALSWIPQSTVAEVINRGMKNLHKKSSTYGIQLLMQVHDSLMGQAPLSMSPKDMYNLILPCVSVEVPYQPSLRIGIEMKYGPSWGELEKCTGM